MILKDGEQISIANGPSKFDLTLATFDRFGQTASDPERTVWFTTGLRTDINPRRAGAFAVEVTIDRISPINRHDYAFVAKVATQGVVADAGIIIQGIYSTKTHKGYLEKA